MPPPNPPVDIHAKKPLLAAFDGVWYKVTPKQYREEPIYYGTSRKCRFSSPSAKYGVAYLARTREAAFAETIRDQKIYYDSSGGLCIYRSEVEQLELHTFKLKKGCARAIDLCGKGCARVSARVECFTNGTAPGYRVSQSWSRQLMTHPANASGLLYIGNRSADACLALFGEKEMVGFEHSVGRVVSSGGSQQIVPLTECGSFQKWLDTLQIRQTESIVEL